MKISIITLFPEMFVGPFSKSIIKRGIEKGLLDIHIVQLRDFGIGKHKMVDDTPYGGGTGMLLKVDVMDQAIRSVKGKAESVKGKEKIILLDPRGEQFKQKKAREFSTLEHLILLCGHYEGIDERVRSLVDETISIGDFVVTGGEIPAMLIADSVGRLVSGVLKDDATTHESFSLSSSQKKVIQSSAHQSDLQKTDKHLSENRKQRTDNWILLEYPQYTMPSEYKGMKVPDVLLSGNHKEIEKWRQQQAKEITQKYRPDLLE